MARVVRTPPYLLILFVCLFALASVLAVVFYLRNDENVKAIAAQTKRAGNLAKDVDAKDAQTAVLVEKITGRQGRDATGDLAIQQADQALRIEHAAEFATHGLAAAIDGLNTKIGGHLKHIAELQKQKAAADGAAKAAEATIAKLKKDNDQEAETHRLAVTALTNKHGVQLGAKDAERTKSLAAKDATITKLNDDLAVATGKIDAKAEEISQRDGRIKVLLGIIADLKNPGGQVGELMLRQPDGTVSQIVQDKPICYISLGEKDGVKPDFPFAVYSSQTGIPKDGKPKAKVLVVRVGRTTSECRILESSRDDPVMPRDLIANVVYNPTREFHFVVEGEFDLYGEGRTDPLASRRVIGLIESIGGTVDGEISVTTDFVVMGAEPPRPPPPAPDASLDAQKRHRQKLKEYERYKYVKETAHTLQIPILNTNRFLAFTGFIPKKQLTD